MSDEQLKQAVWRKGKIVDNNDPAVFRKDDCGAWMQYSMHGNQRSETNFGWHIDHIDPKGSNGISNLRPLQWANNVAKSDGSLKCAVTAAGTKNVKQ